MSSTWRTTITLIVVAFGAGFFCRGYVSFSSADSLQNETALQSSCANIPHIVSDTEKDPAPHRPIADAANSAVHELPVSIHAASSVEKKSAPAAIQSSSAEKGEPARQSSPEPSLNSVYAYTDESKIGNLLNHLSENIEDGEELRTLANVGNSEIVEEIKTIALDTGRDPHSRAAAISASDWKEDSAALIRLLETETDPFLVDAAITALDETALTDDERKTANNAVLNALAGGEDATLEAAKIYFTDKREELEELIASDVNRGRELPSDVSNWLMENTALEE